MVLICCTYCFQLDLATEPGMGTAGPRFTKNLTTNRRRNSVLKYRRYDYDLS